MRRSFYHYVLTLRGPKITDSSVKLANDISLDIQFPKHSEDYSELSDYLEMSTDYVASMDIFDKLWNQYQENNQL